jgi:type II secretion system protein G
MRQRLARTARGHESDGGFTLIELLIVIVILGILAAIVVFAVGSATSDSKVSACKADKNNVDTALEAYKAKNGVYPSGGTTAAVLTVLTTGTATDGGPFLKAAPGTGNGYTISTTIAGGVATGVVTSSALC